jgi:hypothetical protein
MKRYQLYLIAGSVIIVVGSLWILFLNYMLFLSEPTPEPSQRGVVVEQEPIFLAKKPEKIFNKKTASRLAHPIRKGAEKPVKQAVSGYPWGKLQDKDVLFALAVVGFLSFAFGVSYFQLYWKKKIPSEGSKKPGLDNNRANIILSNGEVMPMTRIC